MTNKPLYATIGALLAAAVAWQTLGGPMPASVAQVAQVQTYAEGTRTLVLWSKLDDLRYRRDKALVAVNVDLVRELDRRIAEVERQIAAIGPG